MVNSEVLVLLQSARVLERPWCLIELATALDEGIPIMCVSLTTGQAAYDFEQAASLPGNLESELAVEVLHVRNKELQFYSECFSTIGTQAALVGSAALAVLLSMSSELKDP